jgi:aryl-alcohol dehydrogenase-like predicted oxidoreductase
MEKDRSKIQLENSTLKEIDNWMRYPANRREFMRGGVLALAVSLGLVPRSFGQSPQNGGAGNPGIKKVPRVTFGGTGADVSLLGIGAQILGENVDDLNEADLEKTAIDVFNYAIDHGVTYFDAAAGYGRAEEFLGKTLRTNNNQREKLFLVSKVWTNSYHTAKQAFERTLTRLGTDYIDLLHLHDAGARDMDKVLKQPSDKGYDPDEHGAWTYLEEQKRSGRARFLGVTAHSGPDQYAQLVNHTCDPSNEREKVEATMVRFSYVSHTWHGFHELVPPLVEKHNLGAMIMKVFGGPTGFGSELNEQELKQAVRYAMGYDWAQGCVIGCSSKKQVAQNIEWAASPPMTSAEMEELRALALATSSIWEKRFADRVAGRYC